MLHTINQYQPSWSLRIFILAAFLVTIATAASAQRPGSLDPSFGTGGKLIDGISHTWDSANDVAIQSDGKIVAVGQGANAFALVRYQPDGSLDTSFGENGKVTTANSGGTVAFSVAIQSDGKIVAAGYSGIARYNGDGSLDASFGSDGRVTTPITGHYSIGISLALQPDGKILAGGALGTPSNDNFAVVRYNPDGSLDNSFADDGIAVIAFGPGESNVSSLAIEPDGRIAAGGFLAGDVNRPAIVRYNSDGSLDTSFGTGGILIVQLGYYVADLGVQSDGKLIAICPGYLQFALIRFNLDGSYDTSFNHGGGYLLPFDYPRSVEVQPDGKIVVGALNNIFRFSPGGDYDSSFHGNGRVLSTGVDLIALQADGRIVAAGTLNNNFDSDFIIARYTTDGSEDTSFGAEGRVETDFDRFANNLLDSVSVQSTLR